MSIRISSDTLPELSRIIAERPDIQQALIDGKVLALYYDREKSYFRLREHRKIQ
ncbi:unnamed protein product [marine sediment metagenome]|uniref:Uncharacterized protein n=1 Tax=marine sediment metagenome TaxID=412755 RepID=X1QYX4_9ZZZZ